MLLKSQIMDDSEMRRAIIRISHEILERNKGARNLALIGIQTRGVPLSLRIASTIEAVDGVKPMCGQLDITLYRDDFSSLSEHPIINGTDIPFSITGVNVVLIDDVIYSGRTIKAAIEALSTMGRPKTIQLATLIDRGHRELPIMPNYVGKTIPTSRNELVSVNVLSVDGKDSVEIYQVNS